MLLYQCYYIYYKQKMKKIKNKFSYFVFTLLILILFVVFYVLFFNQKVDRNSYVELISWTGFLNGQALELSKKSKLIENDELKTWTWNSMIIVEWWDWSITRLWSNTSIKISENYFSDDWDIVRVIFKIFSWKTWSNILSYIPWDSHFKQVFDDTEVAVRWTIYTVDLEKNYLYVEKHKVLLTEKNWKTIKLDEKKPLNLKTFDFISLNDFILKVRDKLFFKENQELDKKLYNILKKELESQLKAIEKIWNLKIWDLKNENIEKTYKKILSNYQKLNFISTADWEELFSLKITLKEKLMDLASEGEKSNLAESFFYDFKDIVTSKKFYSFDKITKILIKNKKYFEFWEFLKLLSSMDITDELNDLIKEDVKKLKKSFDLTIDLSKKAAGWLKEADEKIREWILDIKDSAEKKVEDWFNKIIEWKKSLDDKIQKEADNWIKSIENFLEWQ